MLCVLALILAVPAEALGGQSGLIYDLADYISSSEFVDDVNYIYYKLDPTIGYWLINKNGSYSGVISDTGNSLSYHPEAGTFDYFEFYYYFTGGKYDNGIQYNYLDLSMILDQRVVTLSFNFDFTASWHSSPTGDISLCWEPHVKFFDKDFKYLGVVEAPTNVTVVGGGTSGNVFTDTLESEFDFVIPEGTVYAVPYQRFSFDSDSSQFSDDFSIYLVSKGDWDIYTEFENLDKDDIRFQEIQDKLDDIMTGTPDQNEAAGDAMDELGGQKDQIGDLVDQMDQMPKPAPDSIISGAALDIDPEATRSVADGLSGIVNSPIILGMLGVVCSVMLCSYVLFGKKG